MDGGYELKKKTLKVISALAAAALAAQCSAAVFADSFDYTDVQDMGEGDFVGTELMDEAYDVSYDDAYTELPMAYKTMGGVAPSIEIDLSDVDTDEMFASLEASMDKLRAEQADGAEAFTETQDASYNYTSDYYYAQLPASYQKTYREMAADFDTILSSTKSFEVVTLEGYDIFYMVPYTDLDKSMAMTYAFMYSNPQYFFNDTVATGTGNDGTKYILFITYNNYQNGSVRTAAKQKLDDITNSWMKAINACPDALAKETKIAELICANSKYHLANDGSIVAEKANQTIVGCLLDKQCVCAGFSKTFTYFCHKAGIDCTGVVSDDHAWNMVKINGKWYETCLTAMNQSYTAYYNYDYVYYASFNRGPGVLHAIFDDGKTSGGYVVEDCMKKTFTYPTYATDMPLNIYTRVESKAAGQATVYFKNALGASEYAIYTYTNGKYTYAGKVAAVNNANTKYLSYTIKNMTVSGRCGFVVRALFGNPVTKTNVWTGITGGNIVYANVQGSAVAKPKITSAKAGDGQVALNWSAVSGATNYAVYTYVNGKWAVAGYRTATGMYVTGLTNGVKYGFAVKAYVNGAWSDIGSSDIVYATPAAAVAKPVITKAQAQDGQVALNWTTVSGATNYAVYTYLNGKWSVAGYRTATGMYVTGLTNGVKYGFAVKAYVNGTWSAISSSDIVYATPVAASAKPVITKAQGQNGQVALNWTTVSGATNYAVYTYLNGKWSVAGYRTANGMYVTGLTNGVKYGFAVKAYVNGAWTSISSSDIVYATPTANKSDISFVDSQDLSGIVDIFDISVVA